MAGKLKTLIRLNKWTVDERRRELGVLLGREEALNEALHRMFEELAAEQRFAAEHVLEGGVVYGAYARAHIVRREAIKGQIAALEKEILAARDRLAEAYRELKTYETAQANREKAERLDANQREQKTLDEIGQTLHRRQRLHT
jgi:flagellar FliJ protein